MKDWKTEKNIYHVIETDRNGKSEYDVMMTGQEISKFVNAKYAMADYKKFSCAAWMINY